MFCTKCGYEIKEGEEFCVNCGANIDSTLDDSNNLVTKKNTVNVDNIDSKKIYKKPTPVINEQNQNKSSWMNIVSLILGIICILSVFLFSVFIIPISLAGIIIGIFSVKNNKKHKVGLILNIISFIIAIPLFILYLVFSINLLGNFKNIHDESLGESRINSKFIGTWNCSVYDNVIEDDHNFEVIFKLDNDRFLWGKYNDELNNYVVGTYELEDIENNESGSESDSYYLTLKVEEVVQDGSLLDLQYKTTYEIITSSENKMLLINEETSNMHYCYIRSRTVPNINKN